MAVKSCFLPYILSRSEDNFWVSFGLELDGGKAWRSTLAGALRAGLQLSMALWRKSQPPKLYADDPDAGTNHPCVPAERLYTL